MTKGIHHITAIASNAVENLQFYTTVLGLRLVKKTVNQDDVETYHLFFGDRMGEPGMDLTFFIFLPPMQGARGNGLVTNISLAVPKSSLSFWQKRFQQLRVKHELVSERFGQKRILFFDHDNQQLELVGVDDTELMADSEPWTTTQISKKEAVRSFHSATLSVISLESVEPILTEVLGYTKLDAEEHVHLYGVKHSQRAHLLEVSEQPSAAIGFTAAGTVHHIAFRAKDEAEQLSMRNKVLELGLYPTEVINRFYFKSVYFRSPAGILFEIATDGPGFTADEKESELGKKLALPPFLESRRKEIESNLPELKVE
ncbi:ring-cleaving dioxygenase [Patescibacteria group bacterium]|nr:ring-cleaving dioxygenase [Patescibacteria group bacterium]